MGRSTSSDKTNTAIEPVQINILMIDTQVSDKNSDFPV